jgi:hypothetical protein
MRTSIKVNAIGNTAKNTEKVVFVSEAAKVLGKGSFFYWEVSPEIRAMHKQLGLKAFFSTASQKFKLTATNVLKCQQAIGDQKPSKEPSVKDLMKALAKAQAELAAIKK